MPATPPHLGFLVRPPPTTRSWHQGDGWRRFSRHRVDRRRWFVALASRIHQFGTSRMTEDRRSASVAASFVIGVLNLLVPRRLFRLPRPRLVKLLQGNCRDRLRSGIQTGHRVLIPVFSRQVRRTSLFIVLKRRPSCACPSYPFCLSSSASDGPPAHSVCGRFAWCKSP